MSPYKKRVEVSRLRGAESVSVTSLKIVALCRLFCLIIIIIVIIIIVTRKRLCPLRPLSAMSMLLCTSPRLSPICCIQLMLMMLVVLSGRELTLEQRLDMLVGGDTVQLTLSINYQPLMSVEQALDDVTYNVQLHDSNTSRMSLQY